MFSIRLHEARCFIVAEAVFRSPGRTGGLLLAQKELTDFKQKSVSSNFLFMNNTRMLPKRCHDGVLIFKNPYTTSLFAVFGIIPILSFRWALA